jgi:iron(III) transport system substrate-binding protein
MVGLRTGKTARVLPILAAAAGLGVVSLGLAAPQMAAASPQTITLYNGQHLQTTNALVEAFEKKTGITVLVRTDDEDVLADQIVAEGKRSPADVFFTENSPALEFLQSKGLLARIDRSTLPETQARYDSPSDRWVGISARVSVLIYNPSIVPASQLPTSVLQLANKKWNGKLAIAAGETDFQPIVTSVIRTDGEAAALKWLEGLKANAGSHVYPDNETITSMVNSGQAGIGIINQYYWYREQAAVGKQNMHSKIAYFAPHDPGYVINVSGAAVLASSHHQAAAQRFVAFMASRAGQQIISHSDSFEYPIDSGVTTAEPETPFNQLQPNSISIADLGDGAAAIALLQKVQLL